MVESPEWHPDVPLVGGLLCLLATAGCDRHRKPDIVLISLDELLGSSPQRPGLCAIDADRREEYRKRRTRGRVDLA